MDRFAERTGRAYRLFDYAGDPEAERVIVLMGSGTGAVQEAVEQLPGTGVLTVRLFRPFDAAAFCAALPESVRSLAVLDRTKEPGALGEPLYQDVVTALAEQGRAVRAVGGRYGLSSKEFTPAMAAAVLAELEAESPRNHFTVGIIDDVTHPSLDVDRSFRTEADDVVRAVFFGLGSDGTVGANKNSVKIIGEQTPLYAQGYFVYDSKKSGSITVSHLRFAPRPIRSTYLIEEANFVACHQFGLLERVDVLGVAAPGATFLLNSPYGPDEVWDEAARRGARRDRREGPPLLRRRRGRGRARGGARDARQHRPADLLLRARRRAAGRRGDRGDQGRDQEELRRAAARSCSSGTTRRSTARSRACTRCASPVEIGNGYHRPAPVPADAPDFVQRVTGMMIAGKGDLLPVSALPVDGTFPIGTARYEKRSIAEEIPIWDPEICIDCAKCALVCPHAAIRMKVYDPAALDGAPEGFKSKEWRARDLPGMLMTIQVAPDDCTGCGICVEICPAKSKEEVRHKSIDLEPKLEHLERGARQLRLLPRPPARSTGRRSRSRRSRARRCWSRCSSSRAPARAAARRRT